jgi:hypothetical protein
LASRIYKWEEEVMRIAISLLGVVCAVGLLVGCGDSGASKEELNEARRQGVAKERQRQKLDEVQKELKQLQNERGSDGGSSTTAETPSETGNCGNGISTNSVTTCGFAENVESDYFEVIGSGSGTVYSYSPTTGRSYDMYCTGGSPHECTGGNNAYVSFP